MLVITGKSLFLACPMENECREYIDAWETEYPVRLQCANDVEVFLINWMLSLF